MKFRFCGGGDCPDWLLRQINTLSALSVGHLQELCGAVAEAMFGNDPDYIRMREIAREAGLDMSEMKACLSGLNFILKSGTRYGVAAGELGAELEQLGLKSHLAATLTATYSERKSALTEAAESELLRIAVPMKMNATSTSDAVIMDLQARDHSGASKQVNFCMTREQAFTMLKELRTVQEKMGKLMPE